MTETYQLGDRVEIFLDEKFGEKQGWYAGEIIKIDPYSAHRSFYWVRLADEGQSVLGAAQISIFNPKNIRKLS